PETPGARRAVAEVGEPRELDEGPLGCSPIGPEERGNAELSAEMSEAAGPIGSAVVDGVPRELLEADAVIEHPRSIIALEKARRAAEGIRGIAAGCLFGCGGRIQSIRQRAELVLRRRERSECEDGTGHERHMKRAIHLRVVAQRERR